MKYTLYWNHSDKEEIIVAMSRRDIPAYEGRWNGTELHQIKEA